MNKVKKQKKNMPMPREDRDLLIELKTEMGAVKEAIKELADNTKITIADHESRLRFIERYMWLAIGALGIVQVIIQFIPH